MSNKKLTILGIAALIMVLWAVVQSRVSNRPGGGYNVPRYLIQGLQPDLIGKIVIQSGGKTVTLIRSEEGFAVAEKEGYPADIGQINKLITDCLDIKTMELYTTDKANFKDLGVTEEDARRVVKFLKADSTLLTGIVIGKEKELSIGTSLISKGTYVRQLTSDEALSSKVYVAAETTIKSSPIDYIDNDIFNVKQGEIATVTVSSPNDVYVLMKNDSGAIVMDNMPAGRKLKDSDAGDVFAALTSMSFDDVQRYSDVGKRYNFERQYVCKLNDSTVYTLSIAKDGERVFARCSCEFTDKGEVVKERRLETEAELKAKEAKLLGQENAVKFSDIHKGWIYELSDYRAKYLVKGRSELLEDEPKPEPEAESKPESLPIEDPNSTKTIADPNK